MYPVHRCCKFVSVHLTIKKPTQLQMNISNLFFSADIVQNFSKGFCETSNKCSYKIEDSVNIFTVEVETENNPGYDEYRCLPNVIFPRHEVKSCSAKMETETESKKAVITRFYLNL